MPAAPYHIDSFSIGVLATLTSLTVETIRYYERIGLLPPPPRTSSGRRLYGQGAVRVLVFIRRSRELGFSLDEIRSLLGLAGHKPSCRSVRDVAAPRLADIRAKLRDLRKMEQVLASTLERCTGEDVPECPILDVLDTGHASAL